VRNTQAKEMEAEVVHGSYHTFPRVAGVFLKMTKFPISVALPVASADGNQNPVMLLQS